VAEIVAAMRQTPHVIGHEDLLNWLKAERSADRLTNADLGRLLNLPSSRIAEIFEGRRRVNLDEAKIIVETYGLEGPGQLVQLSEETLEPILSAVLPLAPQGRDAERFVPVLAKAVAYGLQLLSADPSRTPSGDAIGVAARGAALRFRDLLLQ
jgi:cyanate lyase